MRALKWTLGVAVIAALVAGVVFALRPSPVAVELGTARVGRFEQTIEEDGRTRVRERYIVSAPVAGKLLRIALVAGDTVAEGSVLAMIATSPSPIIDPRARQELEQRVGVAEAALSRARTTVRRAQATLDQARADVERIRPLAASGAESKSRLERDELAEKVAARELEAAEFDEHTSQHELELAHAALASPLPSDATGAPWEIRSPVAGRVFRIIQESEGPVSIGAPLLEIGDPRNLEVVVDVLSADAVSISPGATAWIEHWGGDRPLEGRVRYVEPSAFTKISALGVEEQRVNVIVDIISPGEQWTGLGDGYRVDTRIVTFAADDALITPSSALFREGDAWKLFVAKDGIARKRTVELIRRTGTQAMIGAGLSQGEAVVLYPADTLMDGTRITARQ